MHLNIVNDKIFSFLFKCKRSARLFFEYAMRVNNVALKYLI